MTAPAPSPRIDVREQILAAAYDRFVRFGYNKTTMAEIAGDCGMSAANLYRYFDNKLDIGAHLAGQYLQRKLDLQAAIVARRDASAGQRLHDLVLGTLGYTHDQWRDAPLINELVSALCGDCMDMVESYKQQERATLVRLLEDGQASGEFLVADPQDAASALQTAMTLFNMPLLMPAYPREVFEEKAESLVRLLLDGLTHPRRRLAD